MLDRGAFLFDPQKDGVLTPQINFANWTVIGAELLITGLFKEDNGNIDMELRLFDTFKGRRIIGQKIFRQGGRSTSDDPSILQRGH